MSLLEDKLVSGIDKMSYTDFVGEINQWNSLPGAYTTLNKWITFSNINSNSLYLDVACTTGLKSRTISELTGCKSIGIDISTKSIDSAKFNLKNYTTNLDVSYLNLDATEYNPKQKFTHVSFGGSLRFFPNPKKMLDHTVNCLLKNDGYILASEFYITKPIPTKIINQFQTIFNIYPTTDNYKEVMSMYRGFDVYYEDKNTLVPETEIELEHYCKSTTNKYFNENSLSVDMKKLYSVVYNKLYKIKTMSNILRGFQEYNVLVLKYNKNLYPNRYIELF